MAFSDNASTEPVLGPGELDYCIISGSCHTAVGMGTLPVLGMGRMAYQAIFALFLVTRKAHCTRISMCRIPL